MRVQGSGCRVQGAGLRVEVSGHRVQGSEFRVQGSVLSVQGSGFRVQGTSGVGSRFGIAQRSLTAVGLSANQISKCYQVKVNDRRVSGWSETGTPSRVSGCFTWQPRPESGPDCLMCARFTRTLRSRTSGAESRFGVAQRNPGFSV